MHPDGADRLRPARRRGAIAARLGDGRGVEDKTFHLGCILNCKVGLDVRCATATAWNTSVRYYGGHLACATGVNPTMDRFGIRLGQEPGAYANHNLHVVDAPTSSCASSTQMSPFPSSTRPAVAPSSAERCGRRLAR